MKKLILACVLISAFGNSIAQEKSNKNSEVRFGAKGGVNLSHFTGDNAGNSYLYVGFNVGFFAEIPIANKLIFQPELLYSAQGSKASEPVFIDLVVYRADAIFKFNYVNVPLMFKYEIVDKFSLEAGPYIGFLTSAKLEATIDGVGSDSMNFKNQLKSTDFGLNLGMNYDFSNVIFANARYQVGLTNIGDADDGGNKVKNSVYQLGLGFRF